MVVYGRKRCCAIFFEMGVKEFKVNNPVAVEHWCSRIISPRSYYLHNKFGGRGWTMFRTGPAWTLRIDNDKQALLAVLKFSDQ